MYDLKEKKDTRSLLYEKQKEYSEILSKYDSITLEKVFRELAKRREKIKQHEDILTEDLDDESKQIFDLMLKFTDEIKQIFIDNKEYLTHITDVSPENMKGDRILKSKNRANNYETDQGVGYLHHQLL